MPYISVRTNAFMDKRVEKETALKISTLMVEQLGKGIEWVMAEVRGNRALAYGGSEEPAAFVRLKSIGLKKETCPKISEAICSFLEQELSIPPKRVYIEFMDIDRPWFGWDSKTFG